MAFFLSTASMAKDYKAPNLKLKRIDKKEMKTKINQGNWQSGFSYKVEDRPDNERALASDPDKVIKPKTSRDPSSNKKENKIKKGVEMWKFEDIEKHH